MFQSSRASGTCSHQKNWEFRKFNEPLIGEGPHFVAPPDPKQIQDCPVNFQKLVGTIDEIIMPLRPYHGEKHLLRMRPYAFSM